MGIAEFERSGVPLYLQLASVLRQKIEHGEWPSGYRLPSLDQLADQFQVARVTARQAVILLDQEGLLQRRQGVGTFVTRTSASERWLNLQTSWHSLVRMIEGTSLQLVDTKQAVDVPTLGPEEGAVVASGYRFMRRVHSKDQSPYALIDIYLAEEVYAMAPDRFDGTTILSVFEQLPALSIGSARQVLTVDSADPKAAQHLQIPFNAPVARVRRMVQDADQRLIYLGLVVYRADFIRLDIDLRG